MMQDFPNMNSYGPHSDMVQEIIDFACSGRILRRTDAINDGSVIVENNFANALERARDQGQNEDEDDEDEEKDDDWLSWGGIREHELSEFYLTAPELSCNKEINAALRQAGEAIRQCIKDHLPEEYMQALNDIDGDMSCCARSRAMVGKQNHFFEKIFQIYQNGAWPCGWEGNYPEGKLIVFQPKL